MTDLDAIDKKILRTLLQNTRSKMVDIAKECNVSVTTIKNRIKRLKSTGIIIKETFMIDPAYSGYRYPVSIGIISAPENEDDVCQLVGEKIKLIGIDRFIGNYDLHIFGFIKDIGDLHEIKQLISKQKGVHKVEVFIWNKVHFKFENFLL